METKYCSGCENDLPVASFNVNNKKKDGLQTTCRECKGKVQKAWYENNKQGQILRVKQNNLKNRKKFYDYLCTLECESCGEKDPIVLDFDHKDKATKSYNVAEMVMKGFAWLSIMNEINKCRVLCSNCHRRKTAKEDNHLRFIFSLE